MLSKSLNIFNINLLALVLGPAIFYFFFGLNYYQISAAVAAALAIYLIYTKFAGNDPEKEGSITPILIALGAASAYFFGENISMLAAIILGANLGFNYIQHQKFDFSRSINIFNVIILSVIVFQTAITKFRGFNNLVPEVPELTIPIVLLIGLTIYFLCQAIYTNFPKVKKTKLVTSITVLLVILLSTLSYWFFSEIGTETILIPLLSGLAGGIIELFIKPRSSIMTINSIILMTILPYRVAGILGIMIAFLIAYIYTSIIRKALEIETDKMNGVIYKITPFLFLLAITEFRENAGLITRFNLPTGYQIGWIFIGTVVSTQIYESIKEFRNTLQNNEIIKFFPLITTTFTLLLITLIIRFGQNESLAGFLLGTSVYLFIISLVDAKKYQGTLAYVSAFASVIGAISFLVLTRV